MPLTAYVKLQKEGALRSMAENSGLLDSTKLQTNTEIDKLGGVAERIYRADIKFQAKYATTNTEVEVMRQLEPYPKYIPSGDRVTKYTISENPKDKSEKSSTNIEKPKTIYLEVDNSNNWTLQNMNHEIIASQEGQALKQQLQMSPEEKRIVDTILNGKEVIDAGETFRAAKMPRP